MPERTLISTCSSKLCRWKPCLFLIALSLCLLPFLFFQTLYASNKDRHPTISAAEFSKIVREFSEKGGEFPSDNFTSNENGYLQIVGKLKELKITGGAYLGVGPEQNFTYIAKIRPSIAFIVDIRRQAIVQHLFYKAIFHRSKNREQFLSLLLSRKLPKDRTKSGDEFSDLLDDISSAPSSIDELKQNIDAISKTIENDFQIPLSAQDRKDLNDIGRAFWKDSLDIGFRFGHGIIIPGQWGFPTLHDLLLSQDLSGQRGNFLAHEDDYEFVRKMQEENRVIPVVGDFGGNKAIATIAAYLKKNLYTVSAFYTSNVEEYLFASDVFGNYAENVSKLPIDETSVFIRAVRRGWTPQSFYVQGDRMTTFLQKISDFREYYKRGLLVNYRMLVTTQFVPAQESDVENLPADPQ